MNASKIILIVMLVACFAGGCTAHKQTIAAKKAFYGDNSFNARGDSNSNGPSNRSDGGDE